MNRLAAFLHSTGGSGARAGLLLAGMTAVVSGVAVFLNGQAVRAVGDPLLFTTLKNGVAAVVLVGLVLAVARGEVRPAARSWPALLAVGVVGGSVPFVLFFTGLADATAPAAAVIHKTLFLWVALLAVVFLRERLGGLQIAALAALLVAQLLIQPPTGVGLGGGELLIGLATAMWAVEAVVARRLLGSVRSPVAGAARMGIGLVVLVGWLAVSGKLSAVGALGAVEWAWILGTGVLLAAYVATWYAALRRAPASAVTAVLTIGAPITAVLQLAANGRIPDPVAASGYLVGVAAAVAVGLLAVRSTASRTSALGERG
jgi:drug/metabolite transporter (DMT)-like permease